MSIWLIVLGVIFILLIIGLVIWIIVAHSHKTAGGINSVCSASSDCQTPLVCDASLSVCRVPAGSPCKANGDCVSTAQYCNNGVCSATSSVPTPPVAAAPGVIPQQLPPQQLPQQLPPQQLPQQLPPQQLPPQQLPVANPVLTPKQTVLDVAHYDGKILYLMAPTGSTMMVASDAGTMMITNSVPIQRFELSSATPNSRILYGYSGGQRYQLTQSNPTNKTWVWINA